MKNLVKTRALLLTLLAVTALTLAATKAFCRCRKAVDTGGWQLRQLVDHLHGNGVRLRVVPSRADERWDDTVYLTLDPGTDWQACQLKMLNRERIRQWAGTVWAHRIGAATDVEGRLSDWQGDGCRVGDFLVFGDAVLIERIKNAVLGG